LVAFYVFLQFGIVNGRLTGLVRGLAGFAAGLAGRFARFLARRLVGVALVQFRPAGIPPRDAQGLLQLAVGHIGGVGGRFRVKPGMTEGVGE